MPGYFKRLFTALEKGWFCCMVSDTAATLWALITNTKRLSGSRSSGKPASDPPVLYRFRLQGDSRSTSLRTYAGDLTIFYDIWWRKIYALPNDHLKKASCIIDLGAHVGMTSLYFSLTAPAARIYAVEADPDNYALLRHNLAPEIDRRQVQAVHAAIYRDNSPVYLQRAALSYNSQLSGLPTNWHVQGLTLDQLIDDHHISSIDLLKVDIEGAEMFLLESTDKWLSITQQILIELHSDELVTRFTQLLQAAGFTLEKRSFDYENLYWAYRVAVK